MKLQLPAFIIADLYKNVLVLKEDVSDEKMETNFQQIEETEFENSGEIFDEKIFLGENKKNISIVVKDKENIFLDNDSLHFLNGILAACHLNLADVAIINFERNSLDYSELKQQLKSKYIFLFDVSAQQIKLPFTIPQYQIQRYDSCIILFAPALKSLTGNSEEIKVEKRKLWSSLKNAFNII